MTLDFRTHEDLTHDYRRQLKRFVFMLSIVGAMLCKVAIDRWSILEYPEVVRAYSSGNLAWSNTTDTSLLTLSSSGTFSLGGNESLGSMQWDATTLKIYTTSGWTIVGASINSCNIGEILYWRSNGKIECSK